VYGRLKRRGRPGIALVSTLLEARPDRAAVPDSPLEAKMQRLLSKAGLPDPTLHFPVAELGRTIAVVDLAYPEARIAIELDGYRYHHGRGQWQSDLTRANALTSRGWRVLRFSKEDCDRRADVVIATVDSALRTK
jgi:very-short-patch-repair endonuclease